MSFRMDDDERMPRAERRQTITDARALRAVAHPIRLTLLNHLMAFGARTASECAAVIGSTPSNLSYHLRTLARYGLVESVDPVDGRERPWQASATGLQFGNIDDPALALGVRSVERALIDAQIDDDAARAHRAIDARDALPADWREAMALSGYSLRVTPAELRGLVAQLDALIRPFIALTRDVAPADSAIVAMTLSAYRHPDVPADEEARA